MSILIKGMGMPKNCNECRFLREGMLRGHFRCGVSHKTVNLDTEADCPLIELPPHGRLIDKQMLLRNIADNQMAVSGKGHDLEYAFWEQMWEYINAVPTITEAEVNPNTEESQNKVKVNEVSG